jgi:hypothetical protein
MADEGLHLASLVVMSSVFSIIGVFPRSSSIQLIDIPLRLRRFSL